MANRLPPPVGREAVRLELSWDGSVADLDLHITGAAGEISWRNRTTADGALQRDAFSGGPEIADLAPEGGSPLTVAVHSYGDPYASVTSASPRVVFVYDDGTAFVAHPLQDDAGATGLWTVGCLPKGGGWEPAEGSVTMELPSDTNKE